MNDDVRAILASKSPNLPTNKKQIRLIEHLSEIGEFGQLETVATNVTPRYLVTYMNSQTQGNIRSATIVSITNQSNQTNQVTVSYFRGFSNDSSPVGSTTYSIPPQFTIDFASRNLPLELTACNSICNPELTYDEGRAIVSSAYPEIGVSSRVYYTSGEKDEQLLSITDSKIVVYKKYNQGD